MGDAAVVEVRGRRIRRVLAARGRGMARVVGKGAAKGNASENDANSDAGEVRKATRRMREGEPEEMVDVEH